MQNFGPKMQFFGPKFKANSAKLILHLFPILSQVFPVTPACNINQDEAGVPDPSRRLVPSGPTVGNGSILICMEAFQATCPNVPQRAPQTPAVPCPVFTLGGLCPDLRQATQLDAVLASPDAPGPGLPRCLPWRSP